MFCFHTISNISLQIFLQLVAEYLVKWIRLSVGLLLYALCKCSYNVLHVEYFEVAIVGGFYF